MTRRRNPRGSGEQLRAEIVAATGELLAASGSSAAVSIRAVSERVGVTPPSIYLHFADKDALLDAVVADVFAALDDAMLTAGEGVPDPIDRMCAFGLAYVRFAVEHPEHYRLATMERHPHQGEASEVDDVLADNAFVHFVDVVRECIADGLFPAADAVQIALRMWTVAHGIAALMITKPFVPWGDRQDFAFQVLRAACIGEAVNDEHGGDMGAQDTRDLLERMRAWRSG
ncbi:TetR/AcrR family transcriptional regulator [Jatrophihabitans fulvus]